MAQEDNQRLKDMLRAIELGEIEEDIVDPEEYEEMGGIKSLQKAPSIKLASETPIEEFQLELSTVYQEYLDAIKNGEFDGPFEDYAIKYFSAKRMMDDNRKMAMYGGRMQYKNAGSVMDLIDKKGEEEYYKAKEEQLDRKYNPQNYPPSQRNMSVEQIKKMLKKAEEDKAKRAKGGIAGVL